MPNWFNRSLPMPKVKRSVFPCPTNLKTSTNIGLLTPVFVEEMLPSDELLSFNTSVYARFAPLKLPVMHNISIHQFSFFVPLRIIIGDELYKKWLNNEKKIVPITVTINSPTEFANPQDAVVNTIYDFLGYDPNLAVFSPLGHDRVIMPLYNPIPYLSYLSIVQNWYVDSNVQSSYIDAIQNIFDKYREKMELGVHYNVTPGIYNQVFNVAYSKDYFNTARPQPQKGSEMYVLNRPNNYQTILSEENNNFLILDSSTGNVQNAGTSYSANESTTIRDLWRKEMLQRFFEVDNTFGTRIREKLAGHFGVKFPDESLQIPRPISSSKTTVQIQEVIQTSESSDTSYLGSYAGRASAKGFDKSRKYYCVEHGFVIGLVSLIPANGYCNGSPRWAFKQGFFDFASPEFNNIGWQDVFKGEVFGSQAVGTDLVTDSGIEESLAKLKETWAYQPRYSEYRSHPSRVCGQFRNSAELAWHLDRNYSALPPLNENFIKVSDTDRIFAGSSESDSSMPIYIDCNITCDLYRPISREPDSLHLY